MKKILLLIVGLASFAGYSQNSCAAAIPLPMGAATVGTIDGTYTGGNCYATPGTNAEWYSFTTTTPGLLRLNTNLPANDGVLNSEDTRISVYTGTCGALVCYTGSDDVDDAIYLTDFSFIVEEGITYYIAFDDRWSDLPFALETTFTAAVCGSGMPFTENWSNYACWDSFNINDDNIEWNFNNINDFNGDGTDDAVATVFSLAPPANAAKNEWLISHGLNLTAGVTYNVSVTYNSLSNGTGQTANESFRTVMLDSKSPTAVNQTVVGTATGITPQGAFGSPTFFTSAITSVYPFTPTTTGMYHLGLHANTPTAGGIFVVLSAKIEPPLATEEFNANTLNVSPNPAHDLLSISTNNVGVLLSNATIVDMNGRTIKTISLNNVSSTDINVADLSAGMYLLNIVSDKGTTTKKFVKN